MRGVWWALMACLMLSGEVSAEGPHLGGKCRLSWTAPPPQAFELLGYRVYVASESRTYDEQTPLFEVSPSRVRVNCPKSITSIPGQYYSVIVAVYASDVAITSRVSNEIAFVIDPMDQHSRGSEEDALEAEDAFTLPRVGRGLPRLKW